MLLRRYNPLKPECLCTAELPNAKQKAKDANNILGLSNSYKLKYYNSIVLYKDTQSNNDQNNPPSFFIFGGNPSSTPSFFTFGGNPSSTPSFFSSGGSP